MPSAERSFSYFLPGYGLSRSVVLQQIPYQLGPNASVRPFSYQQREGYLISSPGAFLTKVRYSTYCVQGSSLIIL